MKVAVEVQPQRLDKIASQVFLQRAAGHDLNTIDNDSSEYVDMRPLEEVKSPSERNKTLNSDRVSSRQMR